MSDRAGVVIVEDERIVALHLRQQLVKLGYRVVAVTASAEAALREIAKTRPQLVLMDIHIEGDRDGIEAAASIPAELDVPVVYLSAHSEPGTIERARSTKPYGYLIKPFSERELDATLTMALERHRTEQALRASEQRFRDIVRASSDWFWEVSADLRYREVWGGDAEGGAPFVVGKPFLDGADQGYAPDTLARLESDLAARRAFREVVYRLAGSRVRYLRVAGVPIAPDAGSFLGYRGAATDITAEVGIEQQLRQAQKMEAIGQLTGGLAHDFNNLLGIIAGNADLLADRIPDDGEGQELVQEMIDAVARGADLTHRLLQFARRQPLQPSRVDVNALLGDTLRLLRRILDETVEVSLESAADLWETVVDATQLQAAVINLATNARDAMPRGGRLTIVIANERLDQDYALGNPGVVAGDYVCITVTDTGIGMPPEVRAQIFEPFFTTKERGKGTGLGLSMVYGFLKQSHGHVAVYSEVGHGTSFRLYLPRAGVDEPAGAIASATEVAASPRGRGERVLVVEDNPAMRRIAARQLRDLGYLVHEAENAAAALALLAVEPVDLLFSDVLMPGGASGFDLAREAVRRWPGLRIVLSSGFPNVTLRDDMGIPASVRLLGKPYRRDNLAAVIRNTLDGIA